MASSSEPAKNCESPKANSVGDVSSGDSSKPKNVPLKLWEKFKALEKRTNETTKRSTEKRIKHLQKTALENVARALNPEDREIVQVPPNCEDTSECVDSSSASSSSVSSSYAKSRKRPLEDNESADSSKCCKVLGTDAKEKTEKEWSEVRGLMGVNDHLAGVSHGALGPKTVLELKIEGAISQGDFKTAEELSDYMADREFGEKVAKAIDARNFLQHKQKEEEIAKARQKKKLHWSFEAKQRWETKSNM